jgi:hypothetical protein
MFWEIWTIALIDHIMTLITLESLLMRDVIVCNPLKLEKEGEEDHILIIIDERHQKTSKQSKDHDNSKR